MAANAISNFYEEHKVLCNIIIGVAILAACVVAAVVIPGLGCSIFAAMAEEALKGAVIGAITGTMGGASGAMKYMKNPNLAKEGVSQPTRILWYSK